jgi:hypothetical protein
VRVDVDGLDALAVDRHRQASSRRALRARRVQHAAAAKDDARRTGDEIPVVMPVSSYQILSPALLPVQRRGRQAGSIGCAFDH